VSDKETAPFRDWAWRIVSRTGLSHEAIPYLCEELAAFAVECTAPAPQLAVRNLLIRALVEICYMHSAEVLEQVKSAEGESIIEEGMKLLGLKDLSDEELARVRAATPQVTPTSAFEQKYRCLLWETHAGGTHSTALYGDDGEMQCNHAACMIDFKREPIAQIENKLWEMNLKRGTSEQAPQELELEQETDGRWIAEFTRFPGVMAYGPTQEDAIRNAAKVLIQPDVASEQASPTPKLCPTCGSTTRERRPYLADAVTMCFDSWHSSAATQKGTK
jgi:hypothetical protein